MTDYIDIKNTEVSVQANLKSILFEALRDNPLAIAEGTTAANQPNIRYSHAAFPIATAGNLHVLTYGGLTSAASPPTNQSDFHSGTYNVRLIKKITSGARKAQFYLNGSIIFETASSTSQVEATQAVEINKGDIFGAILEPFIFSFNSQGGFYLGVSQETLHTYGKFAAPLIADLLEI